MKIYISGAVCALILVVFITATMLSRSALPAGLVDVYGDTSGIGRLTIEGVVTDAAGVYGYRFHVGPTGSSNGMVIFRNNQQRINYMWHREADLFHATHWFGTHLVPVEPYHRAVVESETSFQQDVNTRQWTPMTEYRIYAEVFAVVPHFHWAFGVQPLEEAKDSQLFVDAGPGAHIFSTSPDTRLMDWQSNIDNWEGSRFWPQMQSNAQIDDTYIFVPTGTNMFGSTAVYAVRMEDGVIPTSDCGTNVVAEVLLPIELERGQQNGILGLLAVDGGVLVMVQRAGGVEVTRICINTGQTATAFASGASYFSETFVSGDSVVFRGFGANQEHSTIQHMNLWAFDLAGGGLRLAAELSVDLRGSQSYAEPWFVQLFDAVYVDGHVYLAHSHSNIWLWMTASDEIFIAAYDTQGRLVGLSQVLCGVEEDAHHLPSRRRGTVGAGSRRQLRTMSIGL